MMVDCSQCGGTGEQFPAVKCRKCDGVGRNEVTMWCFSCDYMIDGDYYVEPWGHDDADVAICEPCHDNIEEK